MFMSVVQVFDKIEEEEEAGAEEDLRAGTGWRPVVGISTLIGSSSFDALRYELRFKYLPKSSLRQAPAPRCEMA
jgi:hypothetical protein